MFLICMVGMYTKPIMCLALSLIMLGHYSGGWEFNRRTPMPFCFDRLRLCLWRQAPSSPAPLQSSVEKSTPDQQGGGAPEVI